MDRRKFSIFISSTYEDLKEERQALIGVALENNFIPVGMEQFHAAPASQWDVITRMIDECDFYLLMIGGRYGTIDENAGVSYTEKEYDYAKSKGLPVLVLIRNSESIIANKMDKDPDKHKKQEMLDKFRDKVRADNNTVDSFGNIESLKYSASQTLKYAIDYADKDSGWVRYKDVFNIINENIQEQSQVNSAQQTILENMNTMLTEFGAKLNYIEEHRFALKDIPTITTDAIDRMFDVRDGVLSIGSSNTSMFPDISPAASVMLFCAAEDNGKIMITVTLGGTTYQAGRNPLNISDEPRELAKWEAAKDVLENAGYIKSVSNDKNSRIYQVTENGYVINDRFQEDNRFDINMAPHEMLEKLKI